MFGHPDSHWWSTTVQCVEGHYCAWSWIRYRWPARMLQISCQYCLMDGLFFQRKHSYHTTKTQCRPSSFWHRSLKIEQWESSLDQKMSYHNKPDGDVVNISIQVRGRTPFSVTKHKFHLPPPSPIFLLWVPTHTKIWIGHRSQFTDSEVI